MSEHAMKQDPPNDRLWKAEDLARYLQKSLSWVRQASAAGKIPTVRIGGSVRFDPDVIRAWVHGEPARVIPMRRP